MLELLLTFLALPIGISPEPLGRGGTLLAPVVVVVVAVAAVLVLMRVLVATVAVAAADATRAAHAATSMGVTPVPATAV